MCSVEQVINELRDQPDKDLMDVLEEYQCVECLAIENAEELTNEQLDGEVTRVFYQSIDDVLYISKTVGRSVSIVSDITTEQDELYLEQIKPYIRGRLGIVSKASEPTGSDLKLTENSALFIRSYSSKKDEWKIGISGINRFGLEDVSIFEKLNEEDLVTILHITFMYNHSIYDDTTGLNIYWWGDTDQGFVICGPKFYPETK